MIGYNIFAGGSDSESGPDERKGAKSLLRTNFFLNNPD
jgi:hypothetical protein